MQIIPLDGIKNVCEKCQYSIAVAEMFGSEPSIDEDYIVCGDGPLVGTIQHKCFGCDYWKGKE